MANRAIPFPLPLPGNAIIQKRASILTALLDMDGGFSTIPIIAIRPPTLRQMLKLYDERFFNGFLSEKLPDIQLSLSARLTSSAGKFIYVKGAFGRVSRPEIRMSSDFLTRLKKGPFHLNGLTVATPQEAFLVVFEHELCHAAEAALYGSTGHCERFMALANGLFGHTDTRHSLPTRKQEAAQSGYTVGMRASFVYQGQTLTGFVNYIGKTATVMVPSSAGAYRDKSGRRYAKYRVPLPLLSPEK